MEYNYQGKDFESTVDLKSTRAEIQKLAERPSVSDERLLRIANKIRRIYRTNGVYLYWLTPFMSSFGSFPIMSGQRYNFLGINMANLVKISEFVCYSVEPWTDTEFDLAEIYRQVPEGINLEEIPQGAFELCLNVESKYDETLSLYLNPVILYQVDEELPKRLMQINPLPQGKKWLPLTTKAEV